MLHVHPLYCNRSFLRGLFVKRRPLIVCLLRSQARVNISVSQHAPPPVSTEKRFAGRTDSDPNYVLVARYVSLYPINAERVIQVDVDHTNTLKHWT